MRRTPRAVLWTAALTIASSTAIAQDGPIDIDFGSARIGGPGNTRAQRRALDAAYDDEEYATEDNIPPKESPKRLPHLHKLIKQYSGGQMWRETCEKFDQILEEYNDAGVVEAEGMKKLAYKAYLKCAETKASIGKDDIAEKLLTRSERFGKSDYRHAAIRRRIERDSYHDKLAKGDLDGALVIFDRYQQKRADEDERIWMGEQIASLADKAYKEKDKINLERYLKHGERVAPRNPKLRKIKETIRTEETILPRAFGAGVAVLLLVIILMQLGRWSSRRKVEKLAGGAPLGRRKKNKFIDDDDDL